MSGMEGFGPAPLKVVVAGPVGAGKTSFITSLSETEVVSTEEIATEDIGKRTTTVALDFGTLELDGVAVYLFGTPGQDRFNFMWEVLCEGALGLVLLVAADKPQDLPHARRVLDFITSRIDVPFMIGVTRQDLPRAWGSHQVARYFRLPQHQVLDVKPISTTSSVLALEKLLEFVMQNDFITTP